MHKKILDKGKPDDVLPGEKLKKVCKIYFQKYYWYKPLYCVLGQAIHWTIFIQQLFHATLIAPSAMWFLSNCIFVWLMLSIKQNLVTNCRSNNVGLKILAWLSYIHVLSIFDSLAKDSLWIILLRNHFLGILSQECIIKLQAKFG